MTYKIISQLFSFVLKYKHVFFFEIRIYKHKLYNHMRGGGRGFHEELTKKKEKKKEKKKRKVEYDIHILKTHLLSNENRKGKKRVFLCL